MRPYRRALKHLSAYLKTFGAFRGVKFWAKVELRSFSWRQNLRLRNVPGVSSPLVLRNTQADRAIFFQCLVKRQYDFSGFRHFERFKERYRQTLSNGLQPLILDGGANIGFASVWFAVNFPEATILAVEPDAQNFALLKQNVESFKGRVIPIRAALWHERSNLGISNPSSGAAALRVEPDPSGEIQSVHPSDLLTDMKSTSFTIVKLDIEGAQKYLFSKNTGWVGQADVVIIELDDWLFPWTGNSLPFFRCLSSYPVDFTVAGEGVFCFLHHTK